VGKAWLMLPAHLHRELARQARARGWVVLCTLGNELPCAAQRVAAWMPQAKTQHMSPGDSAVCLRQ
jgi:hypothetical protein